MAFEVVIDWKSVGEFEEFTEAFKAFHAEIMKRINRNTTTAWLEVSNSIVYRKPDSVRVMNFRQARAFAKRIGLLDKHGEMQESVPEPEAEIIEMAFATDAEIYPLPEL